MNRETARGNRLGLMLTGLLLAAIGGLVLARGLRAFPQSWAPASEPLANAPVLDFFSRFNPWIWWTIAAASVVLVLLGLRWLARQSRSDTLNGLRMDGGVDGTTEIAAGGLTSAVAADIEADPAVLSARANLVGSQARPELRLRVTADERTSTAALRRLLGQRAIPHMRTALETERLPSVTQLSLEPGKEPQRTVH